MNREILRLAIPNILSNISIPLLSTVDTALMGRLSAEHLGAVGIGSMIFNFVYWNFGFLRMGTTGITAQFFGAGSEQGAALTLQRALSVAIALAAVLLLAQWPLREASIYLMRADASVSQYIVEYFNVRIWAAPATLALYALTGWFFGVQNAMYPLVVTIVINVLNIAASYICVYQLNMEIRGVALGTVIAQYTGVVLAFGLYLLRYRADYELSSLGEVLEVSALSNFLKVNRDIFLRTLCLTLAFGFFYSQSSSLGESILAVNVILLQYVNWMSYAVDGFAFATEAIVGKYFGAGNERMVLRSIRSNFFWGGAAALLFTAAYALAGDALLRVFTDQQDVIDAARPYLIWIVVLPVAGFACYIWDGVYVGMTASRSMRDAMIVSLAIFLSVYFLVLAGMGNHGLWLAMVVFLAARGVIQWILFLRYKLRLR